MSRTVGKTLSPDSFQEANLLTGQTRLENHHVEGIKSEVCSLLNHLKHTLQRPVTFTTADWKTIAGTDPDLQDFTILDQSCTPLKSKRAVLSGCLLKARYSDYQPEKSFSLFVVAVPSLDDEEYQLVIHQLDKIFTEADFLAVERALALLQIELLKHHSACREKRFYLNEAASDLLHDRLDSQDEVDETIYQLGLDLQKRYRVIFFNMEGSEEAMSYSNSLHHRLTDAFVSHSKQEFPDCLYVTRRQKVILIAPVSQMNSLEVKQHVQKILTYISEDNRYASFKLYASMSNEVWLHDLSQAYRQASDTQKVLRMMGIQYATATYQDLGIYQIFTETNHLQELEHFIPSIIWILKEQNSDLLETLDVFIQTNQSFSETAARLFVHPKTVHYRIDKLKDNYQIDIQSFEDILRYGIGLRLLKLLPSDYQGPFQLKKKRKSKNLANV